MGSEIFQRLQNRLESALDGGSALRPTTVVVVPSLSLQPDELRKIPGAVHFEQRLLYHFGLLRSPGVRLVYVTSQQIDQAIIEYTMDLMPGLSTAASWKRLTLLDCADDSPVPLVDKILRRPTLIDEIREAVADPDAAYLVTYNSTPSEQELAIRLGIPLFSCDPRLCHIGTKTGGRQLFRAAAVPMVAGVEDLRTETAVVEALARLKAGHPDLDQAVVKLNDSFAGAGNAVFPYSGAPDDDLPGWIGGQLRSRLLIPGDTWDSFLGKLRVMGAVVERYLATPAMRSPSAQLEIRPNGQVRILSTHDQILGGPTGQTFVGCAFPARAAYRSRVVDLALRTGRELAARGVIGQLSVDFLADEQEPDDNVFALEVNLRMGGSTAPLMFLDGMLGGRYDDGSGEYRTPDGHPRCYVASDRIQIPRLRGLAPKNVLDTARRHGLDYDHDRRTGVAFYALGALAEFGKVGVIAVGRSPEEARRFYDGIVDALRSDDRAGRI